MIKIFLTLSIAACAAAVGADGSSISEAVDAVGEQHWLVLLVESVMVIELAVRGRKTTKAVSIFYALRDLLRGLAILFEAIGKAGDKMLQRTKDQPTPKAKPDEKP